MQTGFAFAGAVVLVLLYGLRGGGSYDSLIFQENGLVVWWLLAIGVALGLLPRAKPSRAFVLLLVALVAYAAWTAVSLLWTDSSELTTTEVARVLAYLGLVALIGSALDGDTWRPAAAGLGTGAVVVCVVAIGSRLAPSVFGRDQIDAVLGQDRLSVPFGYWNAVGAWGAMTAAVGLAWSAHDPSRIRRAVALGSVPVAALTTYLTYSRAGLGDTALGLIVVVLLSRNRITCLVHAVTAAAGAAVAILVVRDAPQIAHSTGTNGGVRVFGALLLAAGGAAVTALVTAQFDCDRLRVPRRVARAAAIAGVLIFAAAAVTLGPRLVRHGWHSFTRQPTAQASADPTARLANLSGTRYPLWKVTLKTFDAHPLKGTGAGTTRFSWDQHATDDESIRDAHSIWLQNLGELGLPGLLLIVFVMASALFVGIRARRAVRRSVSVGAVAGLLSALIVYLLAASVDWMWESTAVTVLALAGAAVLGARLGGPKPAPRIPLRVGIVVIALAAGASQLPGLLSTDAVRRSQKAERLRQPDTALAWAKGAVDAEPWSADAYEQLGLVRESAGQFAAAASDLQHAISREPQNYLHWLLLARVETERGRLSVAVRDYDHARRLYPRASVFAQPAGTP